MRIAISGTANQGKSTLIKDFLEKWPNYKTESKTYRDLITEQKVPHSKNATKDGQWKILNLMVEELQKYTKKDYVLFDRCPLDNLVYSLWGCDKKSGKIDEKFITKCIPVVKESLKHLDLIFFLPRTKVAPVLIEQKGKNPRKLTPREAARLQGFPETFKIPVSDTQAYRQFGNSVAVPVVSAIAKEMVKILDNPTERIQYTEWKQMQLLA